MKNELRCHFKDARWGERYFKFLDAFATSVGTIEKHHILPRSMFPDYVDSEWNIVGLSPRAHYIAHYILWRAVRNRSTLYAFNVMKRTSGGNSVLYDNGKKEYREYVRNMRWYHDPITGKHEYTDGECTPGYVPGYIFDTTPNSSLWAHDPIANKSRRFGSPELIPEGFIRGRVDACLTKHLNADNVNRFLNLKTKEYVLVEVGCEEWFHIPTHGRRLRDFTVLIRDGVHYLTMKSLPEHLKPLLKNGDNAIVPKPHWNASDEANQFREANHGKTYRESGISVVQLQHCEFSEHTEVRY